jgi:hypothetical protein
MTDPVLAATTPYASVAEGDIYFDPDNHLYANEWWSADTGQKASLQVGLYGIVIEALVAGYAGNLMTVTPYSGTASSVSVLDGQDILIEYSPTATWGDIKTLLDADTDFTAVATATLVSGTGSMLVSADTHASGLLFGGVDAEASRAGQKLSALAFATRKINNLPFPGKKLVPTQANAFPRQYKQPNGEWYEVTDVPEEVKMACCEEALAIMKRGNTTRYNLQAQGVKSYAFGSMGLRETFVSSKEGDILSGECMNLLHKLMRRNFIMGR